MTELDILFSELDDLVIELVKLYSFIHRYETVEKIRLANETYQREFVVVAKRRVMQHPESASAVIELVKARRVRYVDLVALTKESFGGIDLDENIAPMK